MNTKPSNCRHYFLFFLREGLSVAALIRLEVNRDSPVSAFQVLVLQAEAIVCGCHFLCWTTVFSVAVVCVSASGAGGDGYSMNYGSHNDTITFNADQQYYLFCVCPPFIPINVSESWDKPYLHVCSSQEESWRQQHATNNNKSRCSLQTFFFYLYHRMKKMKEGWLCEYVLQNSIWRNASARLNHFQQCICHQQLPHTQTGCVNRQP